MDADQPDDGGLSDARAYLNSVSSHPGRAGDTSNLHPQFALRLANAIQQARAAGLNVGLESGYRTDDTTGSAYDASGLSLHGKGAAGDVNGIGTPGSPQANQWASIATQNGLFNPYTGGTGGGGSLNNYRAQKEFNHWQLVPWTLESHPEAQTALEASGGDRDKVWNAIAPTSAPGLAFSASPGSSGAPALAAINGKNGQPVTSSDPFSEYPTATPKSAKAAPASDPFSEYETTAPSAGSKVAAPAAVAPANGDPFTEYHTAAPTIAEPTARMAGAVPGPNGLVWNANGGFDPKTGELVVAGKPLQAIAPTQGRAAVAGFLNGVPIAGPSLVSGAERVGAGLRNLISGDPYGQTVSAEQGAADASIAAYPKTATGMGVAGGVAGLAPAMVAAPAAFGAGGAGLVANTLTGAATGAGIGAADSVARNGLTLPNAITGATLGGIGGAAGPLVGAGVGKAVSGISNLFNRTTPGAANVADMLRNAGIAPMQAEAELARNPRLVPADLSPSMTTDAGALAAQGGTPTEILKAAMKARAKGADDQIQHLAVSNLGPRPDPTAAKDAILADAQTAASPFYNAARANAQPMDVTSVLNDINAQLKNVPQGSGEAAVLNKAKGYLTDQKVTTPGVTGGSPTTLTVPKDDPFSLLKARQALDGDIDGLKRNGTIDGTTAGKSAYATANNIRGQLDDVLKGDPNIAAGDKAFASRIVAKDDLDNGSDIFKPSAPLADFKRNVAAASADPARLQAMQQGALAALHDKLGGVSGDYAAARNLFAKGTDNRAKMDALFPNSGKFFDNLQDEIAMRGTEQGVAGGSATAERTAAGRKYGPSTGGPEINPAIPLLGDAVGGAPLAAAATGAKMIYGNLHNAFTEAARQRLMEGTARGLVSTGPEQAQFMGQVGRAFTAAPMTKNLADTGSLATNLLARPLIQQQSRNLFGAPQ